MNHDPVTLTGSLNVTEMLASRATLLAPFAGTDAWTAGAESVVVTEMSSTPTHSSDPTASVVMTRNSTSDWFNAAAGSETLTGVTSVARLGPVEASATKAAGMFVYEPLPPTRYWSATG